MNFFGNTLLCFKTDAADWFIVYIYINCSINLCWIDRCRKHFRNICLYSYWIIFTGKKFNWTVRYKFTETIFSFGYRNVKCVFIASDCDEFMTQSVRELCESRQIPVISAFTKKEIGRACGIKVKAAACAVIEPR